MSVGGKLKTHAQGQAHPSKVLPDRSDVIKIPQATAPSAR
jgi:hypothetical protein